MGLYKFLILISLYQRAITLFNGIIDQLILGLKEFADLGVLNIFGSILRFSGLQARNQFLMTNQMRKI